VINPDKLPDIRPDRRKFILLRVLTWLLFLGGLGAVIYGGTIGALAYYGTKNGQETVRIVDALASVILSVVGGLLTMAIGQVFRVLIAVEENTRLIAFHTRPRPRPPELPRRPLETPMREHMRV
jgi:hypothetical protein